MGGFIETSHFLEVFLKPCGGFRAKIWPKMAKSKVSNWSSGTVVQNKRPFLFKVLGMLGLC